MTFAAEQPLTLAQLVALATHDRIYADHQLVPAHLVAASWPPSSSSRLTELNKLSSPSAHARTAHTHAHSTLSTLSRTPCFRPRSSARLPSPKSSPTHGSPPKSSHIHTPLRFWLHCLRHALCSSPFAAPQADGLSNCR
ncbi:hypothetical protein IE81DRAFT_172489 [Ceraceosorus guamensis]|uniref:Uncharacterized protein n=1 Tax=Ceraceosorus guamensis TaxID=1522189 RepID=A0A316VVY4_9BASI|nr:hypothetical protein IE81DRAFT_172489 [Ceraceosorus guamensis]PWN41454.1 hypothetical protein IE81DRAFT_172489 [Ceraceosorus guamensis]